MKEQIKQISILLGFIILIIAGLMLLGGNSKNGTSTASIDEKQYSGTLVLKESKYDFGIVPMVKGSVSKEFTLENQGQDDIQIGEVFTSCMCTSAELRVGDKFVGPFGMQGHGLLPKANLVVKPSEKLTIKVIFDPAAHGPAGVGPIERQVTVYTSAGKNPVVLGFKAVVTP